MAALTGKKYEDASADSIKAALDNATGTTIVDLTTEDGESFSRLVYPFELAGLNTTWFCF